MRRKLVIFGKRFSLLSGAVCNVAGIVTLIKGLIAQESLRTELIAHGPKGETNGNRLVVKQNLRSAMR